MAVVFLHGIATRINPEYDPIVKKRNKLFVENLGSEFWGKKDKLVVNPFWGDLARNFEYDMAHLPGKKAETFGADQHEPFAYIDNQALGINAHTEQNPLAKFLTQSPFLFVDAIWHSIENPPNGTSKQLVDWLHQYKKDSSPYATMNDIDLVASILNYRDGERESYGLSSISGSISYGLSVLSTSLRRLASKPPVYFARNRYKNEISIGIADILSVFAGELSQNRSNIINHVTNSIKDVQAKCDESEPLILVGHSLGGVILYQILADNPAIKCDTFFSIGSQIGFFAELGLVKTEKSTKTPGVPTPKLQKPATIGDWINVYDECDLLGFSLNRIFEDVTDFKFKTEYGLLKSHLAYFNSPSLFVRMNDRLKSNANNKNPK